MSAYGRLVVAEDVREPMPTGEWLAAWAQGYTEGYDARNQVVVSEWLWLLAEDLAQLDRTTFLPAAWMSRERRIAREVDGVRSADITQTDDWPPVTVPGSGTLAALTVEWRCDCPRDPRPCIPGCCLDHDNLRVPGHHRVGYDLDGRHYRVQVDTDGNVHLVQTPGGGS